MLPARLETAIYGLVTTPVLHLANQYGILGQAIAAGPATGLRLAELAGTDPDTTERVLLVLAAAGLVRRGPDGAYDVPPEIVPYVDKASAGYVGAFVEHLVAGATERLGILEDYLTQGKTAADVGKPAPYERFYRDERSTEDFMRAMWDLSHGVSQELADLAELDGCGLLVDVGGANGPFAVAALRRYPGLRATVFDLPEVAPYLDRSRAEHGFADRLAFSAGDFFRDDLPAGDVIALGYVMSNWPDGECLTLLRKAHAACAAGGKVLVMDRLFDEDKDGPVSTAVMNLAMQIETRGRHRTAAEFLDLLTAAGFDRGEVRRSARDKHLVIGYKNDTERTGR